MAPAKKYPRTNECSIENENDIAKIDETAQSCVSPVATE